MANNGVRSNFSKSSGKWYWEITINSGTTHFIGVATKNADLNDFAGSDSYAWTYHDLDGKKYSNGGGISFGDTYVAGDVIGVALDLDNNKVWFSKNGAWQDSGIPADGTDAAFSFLPDEEIFAIWSGYDGGQVTANFGDSAFSYSIPVGFNPFSSGTTTITWDADYLGSDVFLTSDALTVHTDVNTPGGSIDYDLGSTIATTGKTSGKWYWEVTVSEICSEGGTPPQDFSLTIGVGVCTASLNTEIEIGDNANGYEYSRSGSIRNDGIAQSYGDTYTHGDIISVALDLDNNKIWFAKNGVWQNNGDPAAGTNKAFTLPSMIFYPAGTVAGRGCAVLGFDSWGHTLVTSTSKIDTKLTINIGDSPFSYALPEGFSAYNSVSQTVEASFSENVTTEDTYSREVEFGGLPADHEGTLEEGFTTDDYGYGELPGDTEIPASGHAGDSFTVGDSIVAETPHQDLDEEVTFSDEFILDSPYGSLDEGVTLSGNISVAFDPAYPALTEDVTTDDLIETPIYGDLVEDVTQSETILATREKIADHFSEAVSISEEIVANKHKVEVITEALVFYDTLIWGWGQTVSNTVDFTETISPRVAWQIIEVLGLQDILIGKWEGTEAVTEILGLFGFNVLQKVFNETNTETIDFAGALSLAASILVSEYVDFADFTPNNWTGTEILIDLPYFVDSALNGKLFREINLETIDIADAATLAQIIKSIISDGLDFVEAIGYSYSPRPTVTEAITLLETIADSFRPNEAIQEAIAFAVAATGLPYLNNLVTEEITLADVLAFAWDATVVESLGIVDALALRWWAINALTDAIEFVSSTSGQLQFSNTIAEAITFASIITLAQALGLAITEILNFGVVVELDGELWECWVLNTNAFHASVYSGYNFNSFAVYNNTAYGCKSDGIYKLVGTTDDGSAFKAGIVLPSTYFGTTQRKKFRKAYLGLSGGTTPSLKVETDSGNKTYTISNSRANITRDMIGRQWTLKIQDFDNLDFIELVPVILAR